MVVPMATASTEPPAEIRIARLDDVRLVGVNHQRRSLGHLAIRRTPAIPQTLFGTRAHHVLRPIENHLSLKFRTIHQHLAPEPPSRRRHLEALGDADQTHMRGLNAAEEGVYVLNGAWHPVKFRNNDIIEGPLSKIQQHALEWRPVEVGRRAGRIFVGAEMVPAWRSQIVEATFLVGDQRIEIGVLDVILRADSIVDDRVVPSL